MGRYGVTKEDVFTACRSMIERGVQLTQENVRNELKTGSYTTVWRHLKSFKQESEAKKQEAPKPGTSPAPESLMTDAIQLVQSLWQKAWTLAQAEILALRAERDALSTALDDKSVEFDALFAETTKLEEELETAQKELAAAKDAALKSSGESETLKTQLNAREQEAKSLLERSLSAEQGLEKKTHEYNDVFAQSEKCKSKRESLEQENTQLKASFNAQNSELASAKSRLGDTEREFRVLLERAISAEKELSFIRKTPK
jgi:chromosome segregation ATPase